MMKIELSLFLLFVGCTSSNNSADASLDGSAGSAGTGTKAGLVKAPGAGAAGGIATTAAASGGRGTATGAATGVPSEGGSAEGELGGMGSMAASGFGSGLSAAGGSVSGSSTTSSNGGTSIGGTATSTTSKGGGGGQGAASSGGSNASGSGSGGASKGGAGGRATTGGSATGGAGVGGASKGGTTATGGKATGGTATGGTATGGTATGGGGTATGGTGTTTALGLFPAGLKGYGTSSIQVAGIARDVGIYVPSSVGANPPLLLVYHGTGGSPRFYMDEISIQSVADANGFVVVGGQAMRDQPGNPADVDHYDNTTNYDTSWNIVDENPAVNQDVVLTGRMIDEAIAAYHVNPKRVYSMGNSNGAFMSYFVAALLPNRIAAFAEGCGGAMKCANRGYNGGTQFTGVGNTCQELKLEAGYPTCTGQLEPARFDPNQRIPPGFLAHANNDTVVSVAWSCALKDHMGSNAQIIIYDGGGHPATLVFASDAWAFLAKQSL